MAEAFAFTYSNSNDRPPGRLVSVAARVLPGVARVQADAPRFARDWERANRAALAASGPLWVALGDSLTQGLGAPSYDRGWVGQVQRRLRAAGQDYGVVNLSFTGARTQDVLDRQLPALQDLIRGGRRPALVTLMIGSNDLVSRRHRAGIAERFAEILRRIPPGSLVTTLPNPTAAAAAVNQLIERARGPRRLVVAELRGPRTSSWRGKLAADHFHPNERGYTGLADVIVDAIQAGGKEMAGRSE